MIPDGIPVQLWFFMFLSSLKDGPVATLGGCGAVFANQNNIIIYIIEERRYKHGKDFDYVVHL